MDSTVDSEVSSYNIIRGSSGSGKSREFLGRVLGQYLRSQVVANFGKFPTPLEILQAKDVARGSARRCLVATTESLIPHNETVGSFLGIDSRFAANLRKSKARTCPWCGSDFESIRDAQQALEYLLPRMVGKVEIVLTCLDEDSEQTATSLGYSFDPSLGAFVLEKCDDIHADNVGVIHALRTGLSIPQTRMTCRAIESTTIFHFASSGACPTCGQLEVRTTPKSLDFRLSEVGARPATLRDTRGFLDSSGAQQSWLVHRKINGSSLLVLTAGTLETIPDLPETECLREVLPILGLSDLPLLRKCSLLSTSEVTRLLVLRIALESNAGDSLLLDGASKALDSVQIRRVEAAVSWLTSHGREVTVIDNLIASLDRSNIILDFEKTDFAGPGKVTVIRGPSSCGKSTWIREQLKAGSTHGVEVSASASRLLDSTRLLVEYCKLDEILASLYGASIEAKAHGIDPRRFLRRTRGAHGDFCPRCAGLGVIADMRLSEIGAAKRFRACERCQGRRIEGPPSLVRYRSISILEMWQLSFAQVCALLKDVSRFDELGSMTRELMLGHLPLGIPVACCSEGERFRIALLHEVLSNSVPTTFFLEHPEWRLDAAQRRGVQRFLRDSAAKGHSFVVETVDGSFEESYI